MNKYSNLRHPILILVRGLPGSGKSYLANELNEAIGKNDVVLLDPDATNYESNEYKEHTKKLSEEGVDEKLHAYRFLRARAYKGITDCKVIIWNQPFTNLEVFKKMLERLQTHALEHNVSLPILIVEVEVDPDLAKKRVAKRKQTGGHGPSDTTFIRFANEYTSFAHLGLKSMSISGEAKLPDSISSILKVLQDLI